MKVSTTYINITLQATLLSRDEGKWLITSTSSKDVPLAMVVDTDTKNALMQFQEFYQKAPKKVINCVLKHYQKIVSMVHIFEADANAAPQPPAWAKVPLMGESTATLHTSDDEAIPNMYEVEYVNTGEAVRALRGYMDENLYTALSYIINDYTANPGLYYYVFTKYASKFIQHIDNS